MLGGGIGGGFHQDVLSASPTDAEGRARLVEEIKSRAKGSITAKNYAEAVTLYSKAIEVLPEDAILRANRSMCYLSMGNADHALEDGKEAVRLDATYAKGYYRKAMAQIKLGDKRGAKATLLEGVALVPGDKDFVAQLDKLQREGVDSAPASSSSPAAPAKAASAATASSSNNKPAAKSASATEEADTSGPAEVAGGETFRGYKKTSDGRTTTFFNRELDESAKALIGNIAPKKLEGGTDAVLAAVAPAAPTGVSAWNAAGTFEEVIHTPWALCRLKELIKATPQLGASAGLPLDSIVEITDCDLTGDASVTKNRGKIKHVSDFTATCHWTLTVLEHSAAPEVIKGTLVLRDITTDRDYEFGDCAIDAKSPRPSADASRIIDAFIRSDSKGLKPRLLAQCDAFYVEFKQK